MITHEFFMKHLGFSETQAKEIYLKIKNHKFTSNSGILRLNEDTLLQKIEFYKNELDFSIEQILSDFRLLTYDTVSFDEEEYENFIKNKDLESDIKSPTSIRAKVKYFREELGFENKHFKTTMSIFSNELKNTRRKVEFFKKVLGFGAEQIRAMPWILNYSFETLLKKHEFFTKQIGISNKKIIENPNLFSLDCDSDSPHSVKNKIKFYREFLGININKIQTFPDLLTYDTVSDESVLTSIRAKMKFFKDTLGYTNKQFQITPNIFYLDCINEDENPSSIKSKIKFYREVMGFENKHFQLDPSVFAYDTISDESSPTSVRAKIKFYEEEVGIGVDIIRENPILLHFDIVNENGTSVKFKLKNLREIGITNEDIRENPRILSTPALDIKDKYALWCSIFPDKRFMKLRTWFMTRVEKIYARYVYLAEDLQKTDIRPNQLDFSEKNFVSRFKMSSDTLMERYPLDETILADFYEKYNSLGIQPPIVQDKGEAFGK